MKKGVTIAALFCILLLFSATTLTATQSPLSTQRQSLTVGDVTITFREGLHVETKHIEGAEANKLIAEALSNEDTKELRTFLINHDFTPKTDEAGVIKLIWNDENEASSGEKIGVLLPFQDKSGEGRLAAIYLEKTLDSDDESDDWAVTVTAGILELENDLRIIKQYQYQDEEATLTGESTFDVGEHHSFCEWAMAALCGTGGGLACYLLAVSLGITTGLGGLALAVICGLIAALGCYAATIYVCG
jgi:halocin C8-like bacteriocin domain-containing protein